MIVNKIIFLDIDGVLNSQNSFINNYEYDKLLQMVYDGSINDIVMSKMCDIDMDKLYMLIDICLLTNAKIVVSSGWKRLWCYPLIEEKLVSLGLPIVGETPSISSGRRGDEIRKYLEDNKVDDFVILDDEVFSDFYELENYLVKTCFYDDGLDYDTAGEVFRILKRT